MNDRFRFRVWNEEEKIFEEINFNRTDGFFISQDGKLFEITRLDYDSSYIDERPDLIKEFCTGLKDKNGKLIYEGDIVIYYHHKKYLVPVTERLPGENPHYGIDEETGLPLQYRVGKIIRYKGHITIDAINGMELNLPFPKLQWWRCEEKGVLTQVEVIGNIHENPELLEK